MDPDECWYENCSECGGTKTVTCQPFVNEDGTMIEARCSVCDDYWQLYESPEGIAHMLEQKDERLLV